ncbi:MAG TPA: rhodanese-like domain-containing protein [Kouleothrix sp.]|uniref:rhodanese-like domain-containing protein n=1 Tax=Kouleothrix sp. TaxID=2779161 RepID=UPI002C9038CA|nr:rhodanese-like domain-containing protein [Kouleothrix sp.]HRC77173.1 rhodanese-like domain-containing protein [Kouleothrix sp.]
MFGFFNRKADPSQVTPEDVQSRQAAGEKLFILDVREPAEYAEGHIAGSKLMPLSQISQRSAGLPREQPIVVVCHSGSRSGVAQSVLKRAGFTNVLNMRGGMLAWARSGLPVKRGR